VQKLLVLAAAAALVEASAARADVYVIVTTTRVHVGGFLRGTGDGSRLPFYLVPYGRRPLLQRCGTNGFCAARTMRAPRRPYVYLGRLGVTSNFYALQHFRFRVPRVRPGRYAVVIWCRPCGGSLILAGSTGLGEVVTVLP
jgi:hypothetical protein